MVGDVQDLQVPEEGAVQVANEADLPQQVQGEQVPQVWLEGRASKPELVQEDDDDEGEDRGSGEDCLGRVEGRRHSLLAWLAVQYREEGDEEEDQIQVSQRSHSWSAAVKMETVFSHLSTPTSVFSSLLR